MTKLRDDLRFIDSEEGLEVIFNHYSFGEIVKWILVKYSGLTYEEASHLFEKSFLYKTPESPWDVFFITHELEFHWAMLLAHGDMYWLKGIPSDYIDFEDEYNVWESQIKEKYNLSDSYKYIDIN